MSKHLAPVRSMQKFYKGNSTKHIMDLYFNHPVWKMKWGDPVPDMPLDVQLELINRCNLVCESCPIRNQTRGKSLLSWDILKKITDEAADKGVCYFTICGIGEATLHPDLFRLLRYIRDKRVKPKGMRKLTMMPSVLISNAIWSDRQIKECIKNPPDLLSLSLAGLTDEEIARRRKPIKLERFYENVKKIHELRKIRRDEDGGVCPVIHISTHVYPYEIESRQQEIERFKEKWFEISDVIVIKPTLIDQHHQEFNKFLPKLNVSDLEYRRLSKENYERTGPCMETSRRLSIASDGNVWCGHHNSEDFGPYLGNVYQQTLGEIWHGEKMNNFRLKVRAGIFDRVSCKMCGGEIRDWYRDQPKKIEDQIIFGGWGAKGKEGSGQEVVSSRIVASD